jgi:metal-sulfur cluster biosynthetic enzyme
MRSSRLPQTLPPLTQEDVWTALRDCFDPEVKLNFEQVHNRLASMQQISKVAVDLVWDPKWTPHRISPSGRAQLGL